MKRITLLIGRAVVTCLRHNGLTVNAQVLDMELDAFDRGTKDNGEDFKY